MLGAKRHGTRGPKGKAKANPLWQENLHTMLLSAVTLDAASDGRGTSSAGQQSQLYLLHLLEDYLARLSIRAEGIMWLVN